MTLHATYTPYFIYFCFLNMLLLEYALSSACVCVIASGGAIMMRKLYLPKVRTL